MKCRKCKAEIPDESKYCLRCGANQELKRNPKRRGNGQGSVFQRPNKSWIAIITLGYEPLPDGKTKRITASKSGFRTKKEALDYLPKLGPQKKECPVTFKGLYDAWLPTHHAGPSTLNCYKSAVKHFAPIWYMKLSDITVDDLQECLDDCTRGKRTKENMRALCGLIYKYAIPRNMATLNMGHYLAIHASSTSTKEGLPEEAVKKIEANVGKVPGADYVLCQCYLGFRPSELLALEIKDYDPQERAFVGGAKTDAGKNRIVTVSPRIQPLIDALVDGKAAGPIFCANDGSALNIKAYRTIFYSVLDACGIENPVEERDGVKRRKYTPHSCRHTFATMMKRIPGADKDKLELIGHTSGEMLRHYQDVSLDDLRKITNAL